jgi:hypothetical protein
VRATISRGERIPGSGRVDDRHVDAVAGGTIAPELTARRPCPREGKSFGPMAAAREVNVANGRLHVMIAAFLQRGGITSAI